DDREPTQPRCLVGEQVEPGNPREHEHNRDHEFDGIRRAAVLSFDFFCHINRWQARRESNPQPAVLETAALPIELLAYFHLAEMAFGHFSGHYSVDRITPFTSGSSSRRRRRRF